MSLRRFAPGGWKNRVLGVRGQRFEKTEDRKTDLSVFRSLPGAKRRKLICLLSSPSSVLCPRSLGFPFPTRRDSAAS
ncbi:MAG: hypothetical protein LBD06_10580 [Candidatus Accumulibacter sp.]|nr:hypothetical protein [Accumulibacter sp.]